MMARLQCLFLGHERIKTRLYTVLFKFEFKSESESETETLRLEICHRCKTLFHDECPERAPLEGLGQVVVSLPPAIDK